MLQGGNSRERKGKTPALSGPKAGSEGHSQQRLKHVVANPTSPPLPSLSEPGYLEELLRLGIVPRAWEEARFCPASDSSSSERLAVPDAIRDESSRPWESTKKEMVNSGFPSTLCTWNPFFSLPLASLFSPFLPP